MKFIGTKTHGVIDYLMGALLIVSPWLFGFYRGGWESWIPIILGICTLIMSLMTNYELSVSKKVSMNTHLKIDMATGALLAVSPWLFGFADHVYLPHLILGIGEFGVALMTDNTPYTNATDRTTTHTSNTTKA
jgi:hypothetical protein